MQFNSCIHITKNNLLNSTVNILITNKSIFENKKMEVKYY